MSPPDASEPKVEVDAISTAAEACKREAQPNNYEDGTRRMRNAEAAAPLKH